MEKEFELDWAIVKYQETEDIKQRVFDRLIAFLKKHEAISGESFFQDDDCHLESPAFICELIDEVLEFKIEHKDSE